MRSKGLLLSLLAIVALTLLLAGCSSNQGLPERPGQYELQAGSVCSDGDRYRFYWQDDRGDLHQAKAKVDRLTSDERTFLELDGGRKAVLHVRGDEPIDACPDSQVTRTNPGWFPFPVPIGGPTVGQPPQTGDRNAPSGGTTVGGREQDGQTDQKRTLPAPFSIGGQSGGTGGGTAATGKSQSPTSGQTGGTGSGSAATGKGSSLGGASGAKSSGALSGGKAPTGGGKSFSIPKIRKR